MATYSFTDLAPANPKYISCEVNGSAIFNIKKDYIKMSVDGDIVTMRFHRFEDNPFTNKLKIDYNDVVSPSVSSANDFVDQITQMIQAGGITGDAGVDGADGQDGRVLFDDTVTEVVGTATASEELYHSILIPGGTLVNRDSLDIEVMFTFASTSTSQKQFYVKLHTSAAIGGTTVANFQNNNSSGNTFAVKLKQDVKCKANGGNTLETAYTNSAAGTIGLLNSIVTANIDLTADFYINFTARKAVTGDTITLKYANVIVNKKV